MSFRNRDFITLPSTWAAHLILPRVRSLFAWLETSGSTHCKTLPRSSTTQHSVRCNILTIPLQTHFSSERIPLTCRNPEQVEGGIAVDHPVRCLRTTSAIPPKLRSPDRMRTHSPRLRLATITATKSDPATAVPVDFRNIEAMRRMGAVEKRSLSDVSSSDS